MRKTAHDGQAQTGSAELAGGRTIDLAEGREQQLPLVFRYPQAGIGNAEFENGGLPTPLDLAGANVDLSLCGEFQGVVDQVGEHLAQAARVSDIARQVVAGPDRRKPELLLKGRLMEQ